MNLAEMHKIAVERVYAYDYYVDLFESIVTDNDYNVETLDQLTDNSKIISFWNDFWNSLPDTAAIHREPFYFICDICEHAFDVDDEDDYYDNDE